MWANCSVFVNPYIRYWYCCDGVCALVWQCCVLCAHRMVSVIWSITARWRRTMKKDSWASLYASTAATHFVVPPIGPCPFTILGLAHASYSHGCNKGIIHIYSHSSKKKVPDINSAWKERVLVWQINLLAKGLMKMVDRVFNSMAPGPWLHNCREITDVINNF